MASIMRFSVVFVLLFLTSLTVGLIPRPIQQIKSDKWRSLNSNLDFQPTYQLCFTLLEAQRRLIKRLQLRQLPASIAITPSLVSPINTVRIRLLESCDETKLVKRPNEQMIEHYSLIISENAIDIEAAEVWGVLHALETLAQLVRETAEHQLIVEVQTIYDMPRFVHRGFLIDSARHYLSLSSIRQFLDAMAMVKMNVLHWHMVDDESFPFQSTVWPKLSENGAYNAQFFVYTKNDVKDILDYARQRGIRVIPEFDTPGHSQSWGKGYPELLTTCYNDGRPNGALGPVNPATEFTYEFMLSLFLELLELFPDQMIHLGGDEVNPACWASNPDVQRFMEEKHFGSNYSLLQTYYFEQLVEMLRLTASANRSVTPIAWEEVFDRGFRASNQTVFQVWLPGNWKAKLKEITQAGYKVLLSSCWYLDIISYGIDWHRYYTCDPADFDGTQEELSRVLGGEAALWGEFVDDTNLFSRAWPRGVPVAERLWSTGSVNISEFASRLDDIRCQMLRRGWDAEPPNGPGFCPP